MSTRHSEYGMRKWAVVVSVAITLLFFTAGVLAPSTASSEEATLNDFTHTVFVESGSRTT